MTALRPVCPQEVPFDPELPYLFMGEELLYSARIWTHGCADALLLCCATVSKQTHESAHTTRPMHGL